VQLTITQREIGRGEQRMGLTKGGVSFGQVIIEREGLTRRPFRFAPAFNRRNVAVQSKNCIGFG
jgi:hypothetical protein